MIKKPYCEKCKGEGMLPFENKEGKLIPHTFIYCECHQDEPEHYHRLKPEDYDYPMSYDYRSFIEEQLTGQPLPRIEPEREKSSPVVKEKLYVYTKIDKTSLELDNQIAQLRSKLDGLKSEVRPLIDKKQKLKSKWK